MDARRSFIVTDMASQDLPRTTLVLDAESHQQALDYVMQKHPGSDPVAVVSLHDLEHMVSQVRHAIKTGMSMEMQIIKGNGK